MTAIEDFHGPWTYNASTGHVSTQPAAGRPHGAVVASIGDHRGFISKVAIGPLVATAPELLAALKEQIAECFDPLCDMCSRHEDLIRRAVGESE